MKKMLVSALIVGLCFLMILIPQPHVKAADPGLVGYWMFDEDSGNVAHDSSQYGNNGTIHTATWTTGIKGSALHFNGVDSWVEIPNNPTLTNLSQITLEAWIKQDSLTIDLKGIISKCDGSAPPVNAEYFLGINDNGRILFDVDNGVSIAGSNPPAHLMTEAARWYHVAGTWSGSSYALYVNGIQVFTGTCTPQMTRGNALPVQIGRHGSWSWVYFNGIIDEVKIYNYARTAEEIATDARIWNIALFPYTGFASTTIVGSGFSNNSVVTIAWDGIAIPSVPSSVTTDITGSFTALISVPTQTAPGLHTVNATDSLGNWATDTFTVINMTGPQGATGVQGPTGQTGNTGSTGPQGPPGNVQDLLVMVALPTIVSVLAICLASVAIFRRRA